MTTVQDDTGALAGDQRMLADFDPNSQVAQKEIFGPVLTVTPYNTDDEAVAIYRNGEEGDKGYLKAETVGIPDTVAP